MPQKSFSFNSKNEFNPLSSKQSQQTLRTVLVGICKFTPKGRLFFANTYFAQLLGYSSPEELLSHAYSLPKQLYADPIDWMKLKCLLETLGETLNYECRLVRRDGSIVWVSINAQVVLGDNGQLNYIQCFIRDINTHKKFEEALESEQEFLGTLVDNLQEAVLICNKIGRIVRFNEVARCLLGVPEQPQDSDRYLELYDLYRPDGVTPLPVQETPLYRALQGEQFHDLEVVLATKHSSPKTLVCKGKALQDKKGQNLGALVSMCDVTERKQVEQELHAQNQLLKSIINGTWDIFASQDLDHNIEFLNQKGCEMFGLDPERVHGIKCFELLGKEEKCSPCLLSQAQEMKKSVLEEIFVPKLGRYFEYRATPLLDKKNRVTKVVNHMRDITERKELEQLKEDVDRITRHDLKAPLNGILGIPQIVLEYDNLYQEQREFLEHILSAGYRMLDMINMSLSLYQMEQGQYQLQPQPIDLLVILEDLQKDLESLLKSHHNSLTWSLEGTAEENHFMVYAEELLCYTMFSNLIKNAIEATPRGKKVHICLQKTETGQARIEIHNPGVIPAEIQDRLGQKYVTAGKEHGTGLGVYSALLIAETMQGSLSWHSSPEQGTQVVLILPSKLK